MNQSYDVIIEEKIMSEMDIARALSRIFARFPHPAFKMLELDDRVWRAWCYLLRGEINYAIIKGNLGGLKMKRSGMTSRGIMRNQYSQLGLGLLLAGAALIPTSCLLLRSTPITALGISLVILGATCLVLGKTRPKIPPEVSSLLMETSLENLSSLLEELGLKSKGVYLPSSLTGGKPRAIIPLHNNPRFPEINEPLAQRLIVSCGRDPEDVGIMVTTPGSNIVNMLETKPGASSDEIAAALTTILVGTLDLATSVKLSLGDNKATVNVSHPRLEENRISWAVQSLGSPIASIVASLLAEALGKPVAIESEESKPREKLIELEILHAQD